MESRRAFYQVLLFGNEKAKQCHLQPCRDFIFTTLAGNFHGKSYPFMVKNTVHYRRPDFYLVGA
jgi:hypothetical protein